MHMDSYDYVSYNPLENWVIRKHWSILTKHQIKSRYIY